MIVDRATGRVWDTYDRRGSAEAELAYMAGWMKPKQWARLEVRQVE